MLKVVLVVVLLSTADVACLCHEFSTVRYLFFSRNVKMLDAVWYCVVAKSRPHGDLYMCVFIVQVTYGLHM